MFKYRINEYLDRRSERERRRLVKACCEALHISRSQFNRIRAIKVGEGASASSDQLLVLAQLFECSLDELCAYPESF